MFDKAVGMVADSPEIAAGKPYHQSAVSNGNRLLQNVDGRSGWARRMRDLMALHLSDLGGESSVSEAEKSLIRRAATLTVELERMEERFANEGEANADALDLYSRTSGNLRQLVVAIDLRRRPKNITPTSQTTSTGVRHEGHERAPPEAGAHHSLPAAPQSAPVRD